MENKIVLAAEDKNVIYENVFFLLVRAGGKNYPPTKKLEGTFSCVECPILFYF